MNKLIITILIVVCIVGCSTSGDIRVINRSDHKVEVKVNDKEYTLNGSFGTEPSVKISIDTGKQFIYWGDDAKKVKVYIEGETFRIYQGETPVEYTHVSVKSDKTTNIHCIPNEASLKIINNSPYDISKLNIAKRYYSSIVDSSRRFFDPVIGFQDSINIHLDYTIVDSSQADYIFDYDFTVEFDSTDAGIPDKQTIEDVILEVDDQFIWTVTSTPLSNRE